MVILRSILSSCKNKLRLLILFGVLALFLSPVLTVADGINSQPNIPISSACEYDYPPFCIVEENDIATGLSVDLLRAVLQKMGHDVDFKVGDWTEVKELLAEGEIEVLPLVGRTPEREELFDFTFPYMSLHGSIVVRKGTKGIHTLDDLTGLRVAVMKGDNAEEFIIRSKLQAQITTTSTFGIALRELSEGKHDAVIIQRLLALRIIKTNHISNIALVENPLKDFRQDFCLAVKGGDEQMLSMLNEGLALVIADGTLDQLQRKWLSPLELPSQKKIIIGTEMSFPPYSFRDEYGIAAGFNADLTKALSDILQLDIELVVGPWNEIRQALDSGEIDAIVGMYQSDEREQSYAFSPPFAITQHGIFARNGAPPIKTMSDLQGQDIVVMADDLMHDYVLKNNLSSNPFLTNTIGEALQLLATGKHDFALTAQHSSLQWIKDHKLKNITRVGPLLNPSEYCFAVRKENSHLLHRLNDGLFSLGDSGKLSQLKNKWLTVLEPPEIPTRVILKYIGFAALPFILLLLLSILWSRTLKRKISERVFQLNESHARHAAMIANISDVIVIMDADGITKYQSPNIERLFGWKAEEIVGTNGLEKVHPGDIERIQQELINVLKEETASTYDFRFKCKDGNYKWIQLTAVNRINDPVINGVLLNYHDISERKKTLGKLELSEEKYRLLFENMLDGLALHKIVLDENNKPVDYVFVEVNAAFETQTGLKRDDIVGKAVTDVIPGIESDPADWIGIYGKIATDRDEQRFEQYSEPLGRWYSVLAYSPKENYFATIFKDITDKKQVEHELAESDSIKELLLDIITHDLRNPAASIFNFSELAQTKLPNNKLVDQIHIGSERLLKVLADTTILTQVALGEDIPKEDLNLHEILDSVIEESSILLVESSMDIEMDVPSDMIITANPLISEVFKNYLSNATKYAREGKKILIEAVVEDKSICICVRDFGKTIPKEEQVNVFNRNIQLSAENKRGRGLGLAIVKRLAVAHGGEVWVEPNKPKGNSFCLRIPK